MPEELEFLEVEGVVQTAEEIQSKELVIDVRLDTMARIYENLDKVSDDLVNKVSVRISDLSSEKIIDAKKLVAYANTLVKDIDDRRISVKKEILKPYDLMAKKIDDIKERIAKVIEPLKVKISEAEEKVEKERRTMISDLKAERFGKEKPEVEGFIRQCEWFDEPGWMNKAMWGANGTTVTKVAKEIDAKVCKITEDLSALDILNDGNIHAAAIAMNYQKFGNLATSISLKRNLEDEEARRVARVAQAEADRVAKAKADAEAKAQEEADRLARKAANDAKAPVRFGYVPTPSFTPITVAPVAPEPKIDEVAQAVEAQVVDVQEEVEITATLKVRGTQAKLGELAVFMKEHGIKFKFEKE